jgi:hypothetical protein
MPPLPNHIFVCDLGKFIKIKQGSRYELLLWKVVDVSPNCKRRGYMIHSTRKSYPEAVNHYYFTSPRAAAKLMGSKFNGESPIVEQFYETRDSLLKELHIPIDSWYEAPIFTPDVNFITVTSIPVRSYEFTSEIIWNPTTNNDTFKVILDELTTTVKRRKVSKVTSA